MKYGYKRNSIREKGINTLKNFFVRRQQEQKERRRLPRASLEIENQFL